MFRSHPLLLTLRFGDEGWAREARQEVSKDGPITRAHLSPRDGQQLLLGRMKILGVEGKGVG